MSDTPSTAPEPLADGDLDALLSAELDGDLEAAAADLGLAPGTATQRLAATPGAAERRLALARARDLLATPIAALDTSARTGLVDAAVGAARPDDLAAARARRAARPGRSRVAWLAGSAAAVVALGLGIGLAVTSSDDDGATVAASDRDDAGRDETDLPDVGEVRDQRLLRDVLDELRLAPSGDAASEGDAPALPDTEGPAAAEYRASAQDAAERDPCIREIGEAYQRTDDPVLAATATFDGEPARVVVYEGEDARLVVVYAPDDCTTLASQLSR
jgi:hypothetical protein